ncbi:MAG: DNA replication protein [Magnetovibrio sp.]|nr:DNA replication protein [Magnetovibrio sp.]
MSGATQLPLEFDLRPAYGGEDFLVSDENREAVLWIDRWPDWPTPVLCVHGPAGCGKTHLAEVFRAKTGARALSHADLAGDPPRDPAAAAGAWIVEDADAYLAGSDPEPLLHLYNQVAEGGGRLLLTGARPPADWPADLADLRSRLGALTVAAIGAPGDALIAALLVKLFGDRQLRVGADVVDYAVRRMERSFAAARDLVGRLDQAALAERRAITIPLVRRVLERTGNDEDP